jgi:hypothetical protein
MFHVEQIVQKFAFHVKHLANFEISLLDSHRHSGEWEIWLA